MSLRCIDIENEIPVAKVDNLVHISSHDKLGIKFSMIILYKTTPCLNITSADVFNLNEICSSSDTLRYIHFPHFDHGTIEALLDVT